MNKPLLFTIAALVLLTGCGGHSAESAPANAVAEAPTEMVQTNDAATANAQFDKSQLRREISVAVMVSQSLVDAWDLFDAMTQKGKRKSAHLGDMMDALPDFSKGDISGSGSDCSLAEIRRLIESKQTRAASDKWRSRLAYLASQRADYTIPDALSGSVQVGDDTYVYECDASGRVIELSDGEEFNHFVSDGDRVAPQSFENLARTVMSEGAQ